MLSQAVLENRFHGLWKKYPFPDEWEKPNLFLEEFPLKGLDVALAGLSCQSRSTKLTITSSAADHDHTAAIDRSFFELIERISIWEAEKSEKNTFKTRDANGKVKIFKRTEAFPRSPCPQEWEFSKSNGVALHTSYERACMAALQELEERDQVLRSWFYQSKPSEIKIPKDWVLTPLLEHFRLRVFLFNNKTGSINGCCVIVICSATCNCQFRTS